MTDAPEVGTVLLVEDNPADADLISEYLDEAGGDRYQIVRAGRLSDAVDRLRAGAVEVVLLDLRLPDSTGLATVRAVRNAADELPIVVLSGISDERLALDCIDAGAQDYLIKEELRARSLRRAIGYAITRRREAKVRERLSDQLRESLKLEAIGTLAGGIAHEFNNLLAVISAAVGLAKKEVPDLHRAQERLAQIARAADRGADVVRQILTFSRREVTTQRRVVQLQAVVDEAARFLRAALPAQLEIVVAGEGKLPTIEADPTQLHQILINLATNAAHAMRDDRGTLELRTESVTLDDGASTVSKELSPGRYVRLSVRDTGQGMDGQTLRRIFEPFFTTKGTGRGDRARPGGRPRHRQEPRRSDHRLQRAGQGDRVPPLLPGLRRGRRRGRAAAEGGCRRSLASASSSSTTRWRSSRSSPRS